MNNFSEYNTKPRIILVHSPKSSQGIKSLDVAHLSQHNFQAVPDNQKLAAEYDAIAEILDRAGIEVRDLDELVPAEMVAATAANPNSIFTRDPAITLPWAPDVAILSRMTLPGRKPEPAIMKTALLELGIKRFIELPSDSHLEGGDVYAAMTDGQRQLIIGTGQRTDAQSAASLAQQLFQQDLLDELICLEHDPSILHLDMALALLPQHTLVIARHSLKRGFSLVPDGQRRDFDAIEFIKQANFQIVWVPQELVAQQNCNIIFIGNNRFLAFSMPAELKAEIEVASGIELVLVDGSEIAKGNGGMHCLTRPIY